MRRPLWNLTAGLLLALAAGPAGAQETKAGFKRALVVCMPGPSLRLIVDIGRERTTLRIIYRQQKSTARPLPGRCSFYRTVGALPSRDELTATETRRGSWRYECDAGRCEMGASEAAPGIVGQTLSFLGGGQPVWFVVRYRPGKDDETAQIVRAGFRPPTGFRPDTR